MATKSKICIAGKNNIAVNVLDYLINILNFDKSQLCVSLNQNDTGVDTWQKSLKRYALDKNISIVSLQDLYTINNLIFISLEYDKIIRPELFSTKKLYNMHFSKLPSYKGMYTSIMPILNGEEQVGVTFHKIDRGIDTGEIISQKIFPLKINDTSRDLYFKFLDNSLNLFQEVINSVLESSFQSYPQIKEGASYYSKKAIDFKNIHIDLNKTSFQIHNQVRAFIFKEYQLPKINELEIKKSILTNDFIGYNVLEREKNKLILSGIDGFKVETEI